MSRSVAKTLITLRVAQETLDDARVEAGERGVPTSEVLRSLWALRHEMKHLEEGQRVAIVDTNRRNRVVRFVDVKR